MNRSGPARNPGLPIQSQPASHWCNSFALRNIFIKIDRLITYCRPRWFNFPIWLANDLVALSTQLTDIWELTWVTLRGRYFRIVVTARFLVTFHFSSLNTSTTGFRTRWPICNDPPGRNGMRMIQTFYIMKKRCLEGCLEWQLFV